MAKRDVQLVIRAKNEAGRAITSISKAFNELKTAVGEVETKANSSGSSVKSLGQSITTLQNIAKRSGKSAAEAFDKIEVAVDKSSAAIKKQKSDLAESRAAYKATERQIESARQTIQKLEAAIVDAARAGDTGEMARLQMRLKAAQGSFAQLTAEARKFPGAINQAEQSLEETNREFNRLQAAAGVARGALDAYERESHQAKEATDRANQSLRETPGAARGAAAGYRMLRREQNGLRNAMRAFYGESRQAMSTMQRLRGQTLSLATSYFGLYEAINQVGEVINVVREFDAAEVRLRNVFDGDAGRAAIELQFVRDEAVRLGVAFSVLGKQYSDFAIAARFANFEAQDTRDVFRALTEAGRVMNADNEQMAGIFRALTQIMSKGKVQAEELRGQLGDRLSGAFQLMAKAIGVTTGELNEMLEAGEVMADRETILAFAETFNSEFGDQLPEALETASAKIGRFRALLDEMRIRFAEGGFIDAFIEGLDRVNGFLDSREGEDFFESLGAAAGRFVGFLNNVADNIELVMRAFQALFALKVIQFFNALRFQFASAVAGATAGRGAVNALTISLLRFGQTGRGPFAAGARAAGGSLLVFRGAAIRAATAVRSLWMALGGIPGIIVGAIAFLLPNLFGNMLGSVDLVNSALSRHERLLNRIRSRYVEATEAGTDWSDTLEDISVAEARANLRDLEAGFDQAVGNIEGQLGRLRRAASFSNSGDRVALNTVVRMVGTLRDGRITVDQFSSALNRISEEATSPAFDEFRRSVQEYIENAANAEEQTEAAAAVIRVVTGEATDADRALLGLARAADDANVAMATGDAEAYAEAIGSIEDAIPDLKDLREFREEQEKLAAAFAEAEAAASSFAERADARAAYDAALDSLSDERVNNFDYDSVVDRIAPATADSIARLELERELRSAADYLQEAGAEYLTQTNLMLASMVGPEAALGIVQNPNGALSAEQSASTGGASTGAQAIAFASAAAGKSDVQVQLETELARLAADRAEAQREFNAQIDEANAAREFELGLEGESARQAEIARALREAETEAANEGVRLSADRRAEIERTVGAQFDQEETARRLELIEQERLNLARLRGEQETEAQFIQRRAREANIDLLSEEGERYAEILRQVYAVEQATRDREESERNLNALQEQRRIIMEQMELANQEGDGEAYTALREQLVGINDELLVAIDRMIAFYQAMGGAEAEAAIMRLRQVKDTVSDTSTESGILRTQIKRTFANEVTSAVDKFGKAVAQGENFFKAAGQAFRQFAADFLRQISLMIIRTLILRALGVPVGGGAGGGGIMSQLFGGSELHEGGEVGSGGAPRAVSASWFTNAKRYHNGGMPGLGSREVPAILEKGEEVLTRDDPRHAANGGGGSKPNVKIVNAIDPAEFLSKALDSPDGEEAILNFFRANPDAVKGAMS